MRSIALILLLVATVAAPAAEYVVRGREAVEKVLATPDTVSFKDAQLSAVLAWVGQRYQVETAMGLDAKGQPDVAHVVDVQPTLTISGLMTLSELLDLASAGTGWTWSVNDQGTIVVLPPP
ncbi:MAG: hypothetical protein H0X45_10170 [Planctomycetes bacterium]|nr:hypothetical protein [Planctomycetota bacterium]